MGTYLWITFLTTEPDRLNPHRPYFLVFLHPRSVLTRPMDPRETRIYWLVGGFGFCAHPYNTGQELLHLNFWLICLWWYMVVLIQLQEFPQTLHWKNGYLFKWILDQIDFLIHEAFNGTLRDNQQKANQLNLIHASLLPW